MTGAELYRKILTYFKRDDKETEVYDAINDTINDMLLLHPFNEAMKMTNNSAAIVVPAGAYSFVLPVDFGELVGDIVLIDQSNDYLPLLKLNKDEYDELYPNIERSSESPGVPQYYCIFGTKAAGSGAGEYIGTQVLVGPKQQKEYSYKVNYSTNSPAVVNKNTQKIPFGNFYKTLMFGALYHLYAGLEKDDEAGKYKTLFGEQFEIAKAFDKKNTEAVRVVAYAGI